MFHHILFDETQFIHIYIYIYDETQFIHVHLFIFLYEIKYSNNGGIWNILREQLCTLISTKRFMFLILV